MILNLKVFQKTALIQYLLRNYFHNLDIALNKFVDYSFHHHSISDKNQIQLPNFLGVF